MPYLSIAKRVFSSKFDFVEIVNAILYKQKSGCQWRLFPIGHLFSNEPSSWNTVSHHYRKWCIRDEWETIYSNILKKNKKNIDLSIFHIDGSHTPTYIGTKEIEYQFIRNKILPCDLPF